MERNGFPGAVIGFRFGQHGIENAGLCAGGQSLIEVIGLQLLNQCPDAAQLLWREGAHGGGDFGDSGGGDTGGGDFGGGDFGGSDFGGGDFGGGGDF